MHKSLYFIPLVCAAPSTQLASFEITSEADELQGALIKPEVYYDRVLIKFDPSCTESSNVNLVDHFRKVLGDARKQPASFDEQFNSIDDAESTREVNLPDPDDFTQLMRTHLATAKEMFEKSSSADERVDALIMGQQANYAEDDTTAGSPARRRLYAVSRKLGEVPAHERETEILSSLHLLAASRLVGNRTGELLELERSGNYEKAIELIKEQKSLNITDERLGVLKRLAQSKQKVQSQDHSAGSVRAFLGVNDTIQPRPSKKSFVTSAEALQFLGIQIIQNPVLMDELMPLTKLLPCLEFEAEPDRSKNGLDIIDKKSLRRILAESETTALPSEGVDENPADADSSASTNGTLLPVWPLSRAEFQALDTSESSSGIVESVGRIWQRMMSPFIGDSKAPSQKTHLTLVPPSDPQFNSQWYLKGPVQNENYGTQVVDGWSSILADMKPAATKLDFADLKAANLGMPVAVLDSGCSRNPDLIHKFWRNTATPGCTASSFVGSEDAAPDSHGIAGDCVGYDFGDDQPDPTREIEGRIHGSSTSGLIAAESNNNIGITGICPSCTIMCLKIYDTEKQKITMTSVVRALDYIARKNIKISNHSYGGFGASNIEYSAHKSLSKLGHLAVCSAGNNGCNIDASDRDSKACKSADGEPMGPFTPAGYDLPNILSVGGTNQDGQLAWFSNYGSESVDLFAPGDSIVTLYGVDELASVKGTSFSAPITVGVAAMLWSHRPELSAQQLKTLLMTTGAPVDELKGKAKEGRIVSLARALASDYSTESFARVPNSVSTGSQHISVWSALLGMILLLVVSAPR